MNKLAILKMSKKKIIGAVCTIAVFATGAVVGAQIYANASNNAVAVLPIAKGGTGANTASSASTNILGSNFGNYSGILPIAKGGTGANALQTAISKDSTNTQVPSTLAVYNAALAPSATTMSIASGFTADVNSVRRVGNVVSISLRAKLTSGSYSNAQTIATIPAGYRPSSTIFAMANKSETTSNRVYLDQMGLALIGTGGTIVNYQNSTSSGASNIYFELSETYVIA